MLDHAYVDIKLALLKRCAFLLISDSSDEVVENLERVVIFAIQLLRALEHKVRALLVQALEVARAVATTQIWLHANNLLLQVSTTLVFACSQQPRCRLYDAAVGLLPTLSGSPREVVVFDRRDLEQLGVCAIGVQVLLLRNYLKQHLKAVGMLVHHALLFEHFGLLLVDQLLDSLELGKVLVVVRLNERLETLLHRANLISHLLLGRQRVLLLQLELFLRSGLLLEEILDDVALLLYLLVDLLKVAEE